jgi:hypothetical protein
MEKAKKYRKFLVRKVGCKVLILKYSKWDFYRRKMTTKIPKGMATKLPQRKRTPRRKPEGTKPGLSSGKSTAGFLPQLPEIQI